jgi:hypothetical protein
LFDVNGVQGPPAITTLQSLAASVVCKLERVKVDEVTKGWFRRFTKLVLPFSIGIQACTLPDLRLKWLYPPEHVWVAEIDC